MPTPFALVPAQRKEAAALYEQSRWSVRQIAAHFGVSATATKNALHAEGVVFRDKTEARAIRDEFPNKRYPNGREKPQSTFRRVSSVWDLGLACI